MKARDLLDMIDALDNVKPARQSPLWSAPTSVPPLQSGTGLASEHTFGGFKVIKHHLIPDEAPVLQLRPDCDPLWCTPEFRASTNAWLLERFGTQPVAYFFNEQQAIAIAMSHRMAARLDAEIERMCYGVRS